MLFLRSLWKSKYCFFAATAVLLIATQIWTPQYVMTLPGLTCFFTAGELIVPFIVLLPVSFLLYDNYEIELALINGVTTMKLMLCKFFSTVISTLIPMLGVILALQQRIYYYDKNEEIIPIHLPEHYKFYLLLSALVTVLFFASLFLLLRVLLRNCYAPVGVGILIYTLFQSRNTNVNALTIPFKNALFDPFISRYLIGDTVANEGFTVFSTGEVVAPFPHLWTFNRLLFLGIAVVLIVISCVILCREKLHEGFGD